MAYYSGAQNWRNFLFAAYYGVLWRIIAGPNIDVLWCIMAYYGGAYNWRIMGIMAYYSGAQNWRIMAYYGDVK